MEKMISLWKKYREIIMYLIVGVITTVFSWVSYAVFLKVLSALYSGRLFGWITPMMLANVLSWFTTVLFAYITNKILVFESRSWRPDIVWKEAAGFFGSRAATGVFEVVAQPAFYAWGLNQSLLGVDGLASKILVSAVVMVLNYIFSKLLVFRRQ